MDYRIKSFIKARRCVETARRRCVFKIYNVTRLKIFAPQTSVWAPRRSLVAIFSPWWEHAQNTSPGTYLQIIIFHLKLKNNELARFSLQLVAQSYLFILFLKIKR